MGNIKLFRTLFIILVVILSGNGCSKDPELDPYEILEKHLKKVRIFDINDSSPIHIWGRKINYIIDDTCTIEWFQDEVNLRLETHCNEKYILVVSNDSLGLTIDEDGVVTIDDDEKFKKEQNKYKLLIQNKYLDRDSDIFSVKFLGQELFEDKTCNIVEISDNVINEKIIKFIDTMTYFTIKERYIDSESELIVHYSDFRDIKLQIMPFRLTFMAEEINDSICMIFDSVIVVEKFPDSLFYIDKSLYE